MITDDTAENAKEDCRRLASKTQVLKDTYKFSVADRFVFTDDDFEKILSTAQKPLLAEIQRLKKQWFENLDASNIMKKRVAELENLVENEDRLAALEFRLRSLELKIEELEDKLRGHELGEFAHKI